MVLICRRCGQRHDGEVEDCFEWRETHLCIAATRRRPSIPEMLIARLHEDLPHGDWRRYRSRTQRCECRECHSAWLDHEYDMRM